MLDNRATDRSRWTWWLPVTFGVIVLSFLAATALAQLRMTALDWAALEIAENATPSIERLVAAHDMTRSVQSGAEQLLEPRDGAAGMDPATLERMRATVGSLIDDYLLLPVTQREQAYWRDIFLARGSFDRAVLSFESQQRGGDLARARLSLQDDVRPAARALDAAIMRVIELNAVRSRDLALEIRNARVRALHSAFALDLVATAIAFMGVISLRRLMRTRAGLLERQHQLEEARTSELDQFAVRVAHDILSPLNVVSFALHLASQAEAAQRARAIERGSVALRHVKDLVNGLLDFSRAGVSTGGDARADLWATMTELTSELGTEAAESRIDLRMVDPGVQSVRCHPGVLSSLVGNLVRNAIKYIGDSPVRRIEVRAIDRDGVVRIEVEDTGPGLAPEVKDRVFEPYARAPGVTQPGIGLGLATVKRLAESHGGCVGVTSEPGRGCLFWVELPKAVGAPTLAAVAREDAHRPEDSGSNGLRAQHEPA